MSTTHPLPTASEIAAYARLSNMTLTQAYDTLMEFTRIERDLDLPHGLLSVEDSHPAVTSDMTTWGDDQLIDGLVTAAASNGFGFKDRQIEDLRAELSARLATPTGAAKTSEGEA